MEESAMYSWISPLQGGETPDVFSSSDSDIWRWKHNLLYPCFSALQRDALSALYFSWLAAEREVWCWNHNLRKKVVSFWNVIEIQDSQLHIMTFVTCRFEWSCIGIVFVIVVVLCPPPSFCLLHYGFLIFNNDIFSFPQII
jgi:hypothetical protein